MAKDTEDAQGLGIGREHIPGMTEEKDPSWLQGFVPSDLTDAEAPNYPGNQIWQGVGASAMSYKADWKDKPPIFPYGRNFEGGK